MTPLLSELADAVRRWAEHAQAEPEATLAQVQLLRRTTGAVELDAHNAHLADVLQCVHSLVMELPR